MASSVRYLCGQTSRCPVPYRLCAPGTVYRECYSFSWDDCMIQAREILTDLLITYNENPTHLGSPAPGQTWQDLLYEEAGAWFDLRGIFGVPFVPKHPMCKNR